MCPLPDKDALDIEQPGQLGAYLRRTARVAPDEPLLVRPLAGGVSNRTVLVERTAGPSWVVKQGLAKLRVAVDWFSDPERVHREALAMRWLNEALPRGTVPELVFEDAAHHLLAMQYVPTPHESWKAMLLAQQVDLSLVRQFGEILGTMHRVSYERRQSLPRELQDQSLFESLRLEPYYIFTAQRVPAAAPFLLALVEQTRTRHDTLVHGDFSPKNILVHNGRLILLDHEVAHVGDPAFDVGFALAHLLSKAHYCGTRRDEFAQVAVQFWTTYRKTLEDVPWRQGFDQREVAHTLACLLARVDGRSPLEYLEDSHRHKQRRVVLSLLASPPQDIAKLVPDFIEGLESP